MEEWQYCSVCAGLCEKAKSISEKLIDKGYRKSTELAEEIFAEIGELVNEYLDGRSYRHEFLTKIAELKKKYTESEKGNADNNR